MSQNGIKLFWREVQRRRVARVAVIYAAAAWVLIQVADVFLQAFELDAALKYVIGVTIGGLPIALVLSWKFDLTRAGIQRTLPLTERDDSTPSIAVLPFANFSGDPDNEYFSDGLSEEIRDHLAKVPGMRVAARTSSFAFKGKHQDAREIGRLLNVRLLLEGGVRKQRDTVRISAQLVDVRRGYQLWSETFERKLADIFELQSEISQAILDAVHVRLLDRHRKPQPTKDFDAYNLYLLGRHHFHRRTESSLNRAIDYFKKAISIDAGFALAYSGLADAATLLSTGYYGNLSPEQSASEARPAAEKALALNPDAAEAHASLGLIQHAQGNLEDAIRTLEHAISIDPGYTLAHVWLGMALISKGRYREAAVRNTEALRLDPLSPIVNANAGFDAIRFGDDKRAEARFANAIELDPSFPVPYSGMARLHARRGAVREALDWIDQAVERAPTRAYYLARRGFLYLQLGELALAKKWILTAKEHATDDRLMSDVLLARLIATDDMAGLVAIGRGEDHFDSSQRGLAAWLAGDLDRALRHYDDASPGHATLIHDVIDDSWLWRFPHSLYRASLRLQDSSQSATKDLDDLLAQLEASRRDGIVNAELHYWSAAALAALGRDAGAVAELEKAVAEGFRNGWWARRDPVFSRFRGDARFAELAMEIEAATPAAERPPGRKN